MYFYRCTEQQLNDALQAIVESGDTLIQAVFKGGRDWVLICRKASIASDPYAKMLDDLGRRLSLVLTEAVAAGQAKGRA